MQEEKRKRKAGTKNVNGKPTKKTNGKQALNRTYKARLFEMIFSEKKELLELYNAMNGTDYQNPEQLEINTLENAIYMSMHNDISFLIGMRLNLYEHQSTYSPNLPLRCLLYTADLYSFLTKDENLYGKRQVMIPTPKFVIFYNGTDELGDRVEMKLSDAFTVKEGAYSLELTAVLLNINRGRNKKLMDSCKTLRDYAEYVGRVREYTEIMKLEDAVEKAITECIKDDILAEFLRKNRAEAKKVSIYEYDEEKHIRMERAEAREEGREEERLCSIRNLMQTMKMAGEEAMDALRIPESEREKILKMLEE